MENDQSESNQIQKAKRHSYEQPTNFKHANIEYSPSGYMRQLKYKKYFAFGDSFVNMFMHVKNAFLIKIKGKTIKGLAKGQDKQRKSVQKWVKAYRQNNLKGQIIFNFGQVDYNFTRYYKLVHKEDYPDKTFSEYVNWIASLKIKAHIIGILPSPIAKRDIVAVLLKYKIIEEPVDIIEIEKQFDKGESKRQRWNKLIEDQCLKKKINFINPFPKVDMLEEKYLDPNPTTIHLRYLPCILKIQTFIKDLLINIQQSEKIQRGYESTKAERYTDNMTVLEQRKLSLSSQTSKQQDSTSIDQIQPLKIDLSGDISKKEKTSDTIPNPQPSLEDMKKQKQLLSSVDPIPSAQQNSSQPNSESDKEQLQSQQNKKAKQQLIEYLLTEVLELQDISTVAGLFMTIMSSRDEELEAIAFSMITKGVELCNNENPDQKLIDGIVSLVCEICQHKYEKFQKMKTKAREFEVCIKKAIKQEAKSEHECTLQFLDRLTDQLDQMTD